MTHKPTREEAWSIAETIGLKGHPPKVPVSFQYADESDAGPGTISKWSGWAH